MMKAAVLNGPFTIDIEKRPKPVIAEPGDAIVKVSLAGVCGSELHGYRGHQKTRWDISWLVLNLMSACL